MQVILEKKINWFISYVYFYIFMLPWNFFKSQVAITSLILLVWAFIKYKKALFVKTKELSKFLPITLLFLFFLYSFISVLWSDPIIRGFNHVLNFEKYYFIFVPVLLVSLDKNKAIIGLKVLLLSFAFYSIYSILIYLGFFNSGEYGFQPGNPTGHLRYLIVSQYMVIAFFSSLFVLYYSDNKIEKLLFLLVSVLSFITLFINNSRTAQLSFIAILLILTIVFFKKNIFKIKNLALISLVILGVVYFLTQGNRFERYKLSYIEMKKAINENIYDGSFGLRLYLTKTGFEIFSKNILLGTGPKDNRKILMDIAREDPYYKGAKDEKDLLNHFHSEQMDTLTAYGLVGYSLLFFSIVFLIYKLRKQPLFYYLSLIVFLTLFINSFANKTLSVKPLNYVYIIFFILFAIIAYNLEKNEKEKIENNS